jgi:hypothetical protein
MTSTKPKVRLFFPCQEAKYDPGRGTSVVVGPLCAIWLPSKSVRGDFPVRLQELFFYTVFSEGCGSFEIMLSVSFSETGEVVAQSSLGSFDFDSLHFERVDEGVFRTEGVPIPKPGWYNFQLLVDGERLEGGTTQLRVLE